MTRRKMKKENKKRRRKELARDGSSATVLGAWSELPKERGRMWSIRSWCNSSSRKRRRIAWLERANQTALLQSCCRWGLTWEVLDIAGRAERRAMHQARLQEINAKHAKRLLLDAEQPRWTRLPKTPPDKRIGIATHGIAMTERLFFFLLIGNAYEKRKNWDKQDETAV